MTQHLVVFDVDGTLSDSQHHIHAAMTQAFESVGVAAPDLFAVRRIVGLSLPLAMAVLAPDTLPEMQAQLVQAYKASYTNGRAVAPAPLFPGARETVLRLAARDDLVLGIATGKSRRGLEALLRESGLSDVFATVQVADDHPSKPHPSMLHAAMAETGVAATDAVMIGDTTYDIDMAHAAGIGSIGVCWGYHAASDLRRAGATTLVDDFTALEAALAELWLSA